MMLQQKEIKKYPVPVIDATTDTTSTIDLPCGHNCTDLGNARRLVAIYGDEIRYCAAQKSWYRWDGAKWAVDAKAQIREAAKDVVSLIHQEVAIAARDNAWSKEEVKRLSKWAFTSESEQHIEAMIRLAQSDAKIAVSPDELDTDKMLINCPGGTLDLRDLEHPFELREHRREDLLTKMALVDPDPDANGEAFYEALFKALPPDQAYFLQRAWGSALEPTTMNKAVYIIYGVPNGGKTTVTQPPVYALGDYASPFDISAFIKQTGSRPGRPQPEIISLEGKLAAYCEETPDGMMFNSARLKLLSSSGMIRTRTLFEKYERDIHLTASFFIETNELPRIDIHNDEQAQAVFNRLYVVNYLNSIPRVEADSDILKTLTSDKEVLSSVFAWVLGGYYEYKKNGLQPPDSVTEASADYQRKMNPLVDFFNDEIVLGPTRSDSLSDNPKTGPIETDFVLISDLWDRFLNWDQETTRRTARIIRNKTAFGIHFKKLAEAHGLVKIRKGAGSAWEGCHLRDYADYDNEDSLYGCRVDRHFVKGPHEKIVTYRDFSKLPPTPTTPQPTSIWTR
jgi:putative DNA primase/helicase